MKPFLLSLLRFNIVFAVLYIAIAPLTSELYSPYYIKNIAFKLWVAGNIVMIIITIIRNRRNIVNYAKTGAIEAAASVLEFKEVARERAKERKQERVSRKNSDDD